MKEIHKVVLVHFGDGNVRVEAGERLRGTSATTSAVAPIWETWSPPPDVEPAHPPPSVPSVASGKRWYFVGDDDVGNCMEGRRIDVELNDGVVVFREGLAMPKKELVRVVNEAYAVLVRRDHKDYKEDFYLRDEFVLSVRDEEALEEWGIGRFLFANSILALGGTFLVAFAEPVWTPAVVGTLLVAAAGYRVQGGLTRMRRVLSSDWESKVNLIPSGIHGSERAVQILLVTIVAIADLLEDRVLLLTALVSASVQVVVVETVGQAVITWGVSFYRRFVFLVVGVWAFVCAGALAFVWLAYVFAASVFVTSVVGFLVFGTSWGSSCRMRSDGCFSWVRRLGVLGTFLAFFWIAVLDWHEADLKFSLQSLQPWRWESLFRTPDSIFVGVRVMGLWVGVVVDCLLVVYVVVALLSLRLGSDTDETRPRGERTRERKKVSGYFFHYDENPIPSRNLLDRENV